MCPIDKEEIKRAIDSFEDDKFTDAKEKLTGEIKKVRDEFLKDKLGLKGEPDKDADDKDADDKDADDKDDKDKKKKRNIVKKK